MKYRIISLIMLTCMFVCFFTACNTTQKNEVPAKNEFVPGKELVCPQGSSFKMYGKATIWDNTNLMNDKDENFEVEVKSFKAKMLKEADINNIDDYCNERTYFPYLYEIEISGNIDPKYSKLTRSISIGVRFPQDGDLTFYDSDFIGNMVELKPDGSFYLKTRVGYCSIQDSIMITSFTLNGNIN